TPMPQRGTVHSSWRRFRAALAASSMSNAESVCNIVVRARWVASTRSSVVVRTERGSVPLQHYVEQCAANVLPRPLEAARHPPDPKTRVVLAGSNRAQDRREKDDGHPNHLHDDR